MGPDAILLAAVAGLITSIAGLLAAVTALVWCLRQEITLQVQRQELKQVEKQVNGNAVQHVPATEQHPTEP